MKIKVTIPITVGGYTGQLDQWEEYEQPYEVTFNEADATVVLHQSTSAYRRRITIPWAELQEALEFTRGRT